MIESNDLSQKGPDEILQQIQETRASLAEKLGSLETEVKETVEGAKASVQETIQDVKNAVDVREYLKARPWTFLAGSIIVGACVGFASTPRGKDLQRRARKAAQKRWDEKTSSATATVKTVLAGVAVRILQDAAVAAFRGGASSPPEKSPEDRQSRESRHDQAHDRTLSDMEE